MKTTTETATEMQRHMVDQWFTIARATKDGTVAAINAGFDVWERECRRWLGTAVAMSAPVPGPLDAWVDAWGGVFDRSVAGKLGQVWSEQARVQVELGQQMLTEWARAWRRACQGADRTG